VNKTSRLRYLFDLILVLTQKEMKVRYKSSFLGYIWSIAQPLAFAFVFFVAFKVVMRIQMENYTLFLIAGLFPWQWFANSVNAAPMVFLTNASIIKKVNFPRNVTLIAVVLQDMIHFALSIPVLVFFMLIYSELPTLSWLYGIPVLLAMQFMMVYGLSLVISSINLFFRDLERLVIIFTTFIFYFTPIIYPASMIPDKYKPLMNFNPLAPLMTSWRNLFLNGVLDPTSLAISFAYSAIAFMAGYMVYKRFSWKFAEVL
jgi:lipopolysaccharide transport system permease protein